jgi:hypothetical protein
MPAGYSEPKVRKCLRSHAAVGRKMIWTNVYESAMLTCHQCCLATDPTTHRMWPCQRHAGKRYGVYLAPYRRGRTARTHWHQASLTQMRKTHTQEYCASIKRLSPVLAWMLKTNRGNFAHLPQLCGAGQARPLPKIPQTLIHRESRRWMSPRGASVVISQLSCPIRFLLKRNLQLFGFDDASGGVQTQRPE